ncbi:limonene-1,2-epoxide hydrolase family protein [Allosalinactinospora lopnorensis]|uniref:limonene-1,2-epoxide hydrolase family protein n=1 Tax=Allosalinactinospora lopnorensis TaxID=1352348 RepID=UPI000B00E981|nr:limonene-1,2-epoxide hydrolase family protein [Allosalinactinospora lopnorensis]
MLSPSESSNANETLVVQFFTDMGETYDQMKAAFDRYLADDCVWANQGLPEVRGKAEIFGFLQAFVEQTGLECVHGEVLNIASAGQVVLTERHERWTGEDGKVLVESLPVMGTFEIENGMIRAWRDYFDPTKFAHLAPAADTDQ